MEFEVQPLGDSSLLVRYEQRCSFSLCNLMHCLSSQIVKSKPLGITEVVPAINSFAVYYDPHLISYEALENALITLFDKNDEPHFSVGNRVEIPVCYSAEFAPDLEEVAHYRSLSTSEVIRQHCSVEYFVAMIGFAPGFPYLIGLPPTLATPRQSSPRTSVATGSVAIGGEFTGIYPHQSPGGWNIIGRTPLSLFDPGKELPSFLTPGDTVKFTAIDEYDYRQRIQRQGREARKYA